MEEHCVLNWEGRYKQLLIRKGRGCGDKGGRVRKQQCRPEAGLCIPSRDAHKISEFFCRNNLVQFSHSCPALSNPMECSTPGLPVHHQLPEFTQTLVHWVGDAIQPSLPLLSPSPPVLNLHPGISYSNWRKSKTKRKKKNFKDVKGKNLTYREAMIRITWGTL